LAEEGIESQHEDEGAIVALGEGSRYNARSEGRNEVSKEKGTRGVDDVALIRYESYEKFCSSSGEVFDTSGAASGVASLEGWELIVARGMISRAEEREEWCGLGKARGKVS